MHFVHMYSLCMYVICYCKCMRRVYETRSSAVAKF